MDSGLGLRDPNIHKYLHWAAKSANISYVGLFGPLYTPMSSPFPFEFPFACPFDSPSFG